MERWTIAEPFDGRYRLHISFGGGGRFWCMFDFAVHPEPGTAGVEVELGAGADAASVEWFPHIRAGMLRGLQSERERGREWVGIRVEVRRVHTHPLDTTSNGCEYYGFHFVYGELPPHGVRLDG